MFAILQIILSNKTEYSSTATPQEIFLPLKAVEKRNCKDRKERREDEGKNGMMPLRIAKAEEKMLRNIMHATAQQTGVYFILFNINSS